MANDTTRTSGKPPSYKDDRGKSNLINHPILAVVKDNIDPTRNGRIRVYSAEFGGMDPNNEKNWIRVSYMSPWFGGITPKKDTKKPDSSKYGEFVGNPISYGMWASAPDIGTTVICIFVNGLIDQGYYIGSPPTAGTHQMVPAIGSTKFVVPNKTEATTYGDAKLLPTSEVNISDSGIKNSTAIYAEAKPIHSYQAAILNQQGLIRDPLRGTISSSSQRETPSRVFGISTPGGSIYEGGYTNNTIAGAIKDADISKVQLAGRVGGHTVVMDDGTVDGKDQLMRFRTSAGHTIMMNDTGQNIFIIHSNGQSWIELGKEGTIDIWSSNSFNVRSLGDINFHADRDVNIHAGRNLHMFGDSVKIESDKSMTVKTNLDFSAMHGGKYELNVGSSMNLKSGGAASFNAGGSNFINGSPILLNTGAYPGPKQVDPIDKKDHKDTVFSTEVGWMYPAPNPVISIASRVTTHQPFPGANLGVDLKVPNQTVSAGNPQPQPSTSVQAVNNNTSPVPQNPIAPAAAATTPTTVPSVTNRGQTVLSSETVATAISQQAATVQEFTPELQIGQGTIPGTQTGLNTRQAIDGGVQKPGTEQIINQLLGQGMSYEEAAQLAMTGLDGVQKPGDLLNNVPKQVQVVAGSIQKATTGLISKNIISGLESPLQTTGLIAAASRFGTETVANITKNIQATVGGIRSAVTGAFDQVKGIGEMISSGKFAAAVSTNVTGAITSITGAVSGLFGGRGAKSTPTIAQLTQGLIQRNTQEFLAKQESIKPLSPGVPNDLSTGQPVQVSEPTEYMELKAAMDKTNQLKQDLLEAKQAASRAANAENLARIAELEKMLSESEKKSSALLSNIIESSNNESAVNITNIVSRDSNIVADIKNLGTILQNRTIRTATSITEGLKKFADPEKLAGNLLENAKTAIGNNAVFSKIQGLLGRSRAGGQQVQSVTYASDTWDNPAITAKTGQLLGDPIIPPPVFGEPATPINPDEYLREQTALLDRINRLDNERRMIEIRLDAAYGLLNDPNAGVEAYRQIDNLKQELNTIEVEIQLTDAEYQQLINR